MNMQKGLQIYEIIPLTTKGEINKDKTYKAALNRLDIHMMLYNIL